MLGKKRNRGLSEGVSAVLLSFPNQSHRINKNDCSFHCLPLLCLADYRGPALLCFVTLAEILLQSFGVEPDAARNQKG
jgi:hypothetical protein